MRSQRLFWLPALLVALILAACQAPGAPGLVSGAPLPSASPTRPPAAAPSPQATSLPAPASVDLAATATALPATLAAASGQVPEYTYRVVNTYPHTPWAFTQGLVYQDGIFYEGTGLYSQSTLRQVDPASGAPLRSIRLPDEYFGEGIALLGDRLYQLTWRQNTGFVYAKDTLELLGSWSYTGEGWGLTTDGERLIMSDGTNALRFLDPVTLQELGRVEVVDAANTPIVWLNELEWVEGEVWANVWQTDQIARIDPASGRLLGWIDLAGLLPAQDRVGQQVDVLNGIAYDAATGRLFVTGKWWPKLFEIELVGVQP